MHDIKVLGISCPKCKATVKLIEELARGEDAAICVEKVENVAEIASYGVLSTPAVVIDGTVVHSGGVPTRQSVESWLRELKPD